MTPRALGAGRLACERTLQPAAPAGRACGSCFMAQSKRGGSFLFQASPVTLCAAPGLLAVTWGQSPRDRAPVVSPQGVVGTALGVWPEALGAFSLLPGILTQGSTVLWNGFKAQKSL